MQLSEKKCVPCEGGVDPLSSSQVKLFHQLLNQEWKVMDDLKILRTFHFVNFTQTMAFVNKVADIAEEEGHHPDLNVSYGKCIIEIWTHAINGLSENDFILAAKIDKVVV